MNSKKPMQTLAGLATARGFAVGPAYVYRGDGDIPVPEYVVDPGRVAGELQRLMRARLETRRDLEGLIAALRERAGHADVKIFESHMMLLGDIVLVEETEKHIRESRLNAEAAVRKTADHARAQF